jgi:hypothetical protein
VDFHLLLFAGFHRRTKIQDFRKHATTVGTGTVTVPAFQIRHLAGKIDRLEGKHP